MWTCVRSAECGIEVGGKRDGPAPAWTSTCRELRDAVTVDEGCHLANDERGNRIRVCRGLTTPWSQLWASVRRLS
jgi:hypothetical protein